eukprot:gene9271-10249_t
MPLFRKPSFKANRKIPDRRADAGATNTQLVDRQSLNPSLDFEQNPVDLAIGDKRYVFQEGQWLSKDGDESDGQSIQSKKEVQKLKKRLKESEEENNLLRYKIELLLDMVAVSNSDMDAMQSELEQLRAFKDRTETKSIRK